MVLRFVLLAVVLFTAFGSRPSFADQNGNNISYVASYGNDGNACTLSSPCATLSVGAAKTVTGGLVTCLNVPADQGMYITSSVAIECVGFSSTAITINLPSSDSLQTVHLKGITCTGLNVIQSGLVIYGAKTVILEQVGVKWFTGQGIYDRRTSPGKLVIKDAVIGPNGGAGIVVAGSAGHTAVLDNVTSTANTYGIAVAAGNRVTISRSDFSGNSIAGVEADGGSLVVVDGSTISNNNVGVQSGSAIRLSNNNITFNITGVNGATGTYGNNRFAGNGTDGTALTPVGSSSTDLAQK